MTEKRLKYLIENFKSNVLSIEEQKELFELYDSLDVLPSFTNKFIESEKSIYQEYLFSKIEKKTNTTIKSIGVRSKIIKMSKYIPAAIAIIVCVVSLMINSNKYEADLTSKHLTNYTGNQDLAIVTLPSGEQFEIGNNNDIISTNNIQIAKVENNKWKYKFASTNSDHIHKTPVKIQIPRGASQTIVLPDGSEVDLNAESSITIPVDFEQNRLVVLEGNANFDIKHIAMLPFIVETKHQSVKVLGTKFNVSAYADDAYTKTTLFNGKIELFFPLSNQREKLIPGDSFELNNNNKTLQRNSLEKHKLALLEEGFILFENESLSQILTLIERKYDLKIYVDPSLKSYKFTGVIPRNADLKAFLTALQESQTFHYKLENKTLRITK